MRKQHTVGSIFFFEPTNQIVIIVANKGRFAEKPLQLVFFDSPNFYPYTVMAQNISEVKDILDGCEYIGNVKDLDFTSFIAERIEAKPR